MPDQNAKSYLIGMKFDTWWFLGSLIMNPFSPFRNSNGEIQYSRHKSKNAIDWDQIWYPGILGSLITNWAQKNTKIYFIGIKLASQEFSESSNF